MTITELREYIEGLIKENHLFGFHTERMDVETDLLNDILNKVKEVEKNEKNAKYSNK